MNIFFKIEKIKLEYFSIAALLIVCMPFLILCFFAHPFFIDDYTFVDKFERLGLIHAFLDWYNNWTGRYSLCFLMSLNHLIIGSLFLYRTVVFVLIVSVPILSFFLFKTFFRKPSNSFCISFTALFSFLYFYQLPSINEGLYWMTGALAYHLPTLCLLVILMLLFKICTHRGNMAVNVFASSFLVIVLIGTNEISMITMVVFLLLIIGYRLAFRIPNNGGLYLILAVSIVASYFVIQAPGNAARSELFPLAEDWRQAIQMTIIGLGYYVSQWIGVACLVAIVGLYILKNTKTSLQYEMRSIPFALSGGIFLLVLLAGFFVPAWSTGQMPNPRAINVLFAIFLIGFFYHVSIFYQQRVAVRHNLFTGISRIGLLLTVCSVFFITFSPSKGVSNNIKTAYIDILSSKAYLFDRSMINLYNLKHWNGGFSKGNLPVSLSWEISEENYKGYPEQYFKTHHK